MQEQPVWPTCLVDSSVLCSKQISLYPATILHKCCGNYTYGPQLGRALVIAGESRQVIQIPGAPPVTIRFGARPGPTQAPAANPQVIFSLLYCLSQQALNSNRSTEQQQMSQSLCCMLAQLCVSCVLQMLPVLSTKGW